MTPDLGSNRTPPLPSGEAKSTWVYIKSEPSLWTVGFYRPDGSWEAESDHSSTEQAVERIGYLNGRNDSERLRAQNRDLLAALEAALPAIDYLADEMPGFDGVPWAIVADEARAAIAAVEGGSS